ncbi:MAG: hypothetical protein ACK56F_10285 [bacterium]|jgi:hypothetical protein
MRVNGFSDHDRPLFQPSRSEISLPPVVHLSYALRLCNSIELVITPNPTDIQVFSTITHMIRTKNFFSENKTAVSVKIMQFGSN